MRRSNGNRARLGALVFAVALGAAALLALPAIGTGHPRSDEAAGTVESFDSTTGQLVVDLAKGDTISALVTPRTHIRCGDEGRRRHGHRHPFGHHGDHSASASSRGEHEGAEPPEEENEGQRGDRPRGPGGPGGDDDFPHGDDFPGQGPPEGDEHRGRGNDDHGERCLDQLVPGAVVRGAEIILIDGNAFYKEVGLEPAAPAPSS